TVLAIIAERLGVPRLALVDAPGEVRASAAPLERRLHVALGRYREYLGRNLHFDDDNARRVLARHGLRPPALGGAEMRRLVAEALRQPRPTRRRSTALSEAPRDEGTEIAAQREP